MAEKKKAGVQVKPPEQSEQVPETVQTPMTEATVAPEMRYSLQARVDRLVDKPDGKLRAILSMNLPGGFAVHGIKIYENDGGLFVSMPQSSYTQELRVEKQVDEATGKYKVRYSYDGKRWQDADMPDYRINWYEDGESSCLSKNKSRHYTRGRLNFFKILCIVFNSVPSSVADNFSSKRHCSSVRYRVPSLKLFTMKTPPSAP